MTLQKDWTKTQVRLPPDLYPFIKQYAKDNDLSMNTAIIELLKKSLQPTTQAVASTGVTTPTHIEQRLDELHQEICEIKKVLKEKNT